MTYHVADEYSGYVADVRYEQQPHAYVDEPAVNVPPPVFYGDAVDSYGVQNSKH